MSEALALPRDLLRLAAGWAVDQELDGLRLRAIANHFEYGLSTSFADGFVDGDDLAAEELERERGALLAPPLQGRRTNPARPEPASAAPSARLSCTTPRCSGPAA